MTSPPRTTPAAPNRGSSSAVPPDVDAIAAAVVQSPFVAALSGGIETYLPGRRVAGVRIGPDEVEVHVVARWDSAVPDLAADVRRAVSAAADGRCVAVHIDDIEVPSADVSRT